MPVYDLKCDKCSHDLKDQIYKYDEVQAGIPCEVEHCGGKYFIVIPLVHYTYSGVEYDNKREPKWHVDGKTLKNGLQPK